MKVGDVIVSNLGGKQHRAVCVGINTQGCIALVLATSKIKKVNKHAARKDIMHSPESLVIIKKDAYQSKKNSEVCSLTKDTCFDCNNMIIQYAEGLQKSAVHCDPISKNLVDKILLAIKMSPAIEQYSKERFSL